MKRYTDREISLLLPSEVDWYLTSETFYSKNQGCYIKIKRGHIKGSDKQEVIQIIPQ